MPPPPRHSGSLLLRLLRDHRLRGHQQAGDRSGVLQRRSHDLGRVNDAGLYQVLELAGLRVKAPVVLVSVEDLAGDYRTILAGILGNLAQRRLHRFSDDLDAKALIVIVRPQLRQDERCTCQWYTAAR